MKADHKANGNIIAKTGLSVYSHHDTKKHAVETIENTGNLLNTRGQKIGYNAFNKASYLIDTVSNNAYRLDIVYGPDQQRWKTVLKKNGNPTKTVIFAGDYERVTKSDTITHLYYMPGGGIYVKQLKGSVTLKNGMYYAHPDHLGSLAMVTDASGNMVQKCTFDAWGCRSFVTKDRSLIFDRGYTGHEHLDEFSLINMNGRMYDPVVGRFLSPDPYVADGTFSQDYNRYSYARNNPLIYTDPDGEWVHIVVGAVVGGIVNTVVHWKQFRGFWDGVAAFGIGAAGGAITAATGGAAMGVFGGTAAVSAGAGGLIGGAVSGGVSYYTGTMYTSMANTAYFGDPLISGKELLTGTLTSMLTAGTLQGINASIHGRSFINGDIKVPKAPLTTPASQPGLQLKSSKPELDTKGLKAKPARLTLHDPEEGMYVLDNTKRQVLLNPQTDEIKYIRADNFRQSLVEASGINPANAQAHHVFPQTFAEKFSRAGVDVNRYGVWWETTSHLKNANQYNQAWKVFFDTYSAPTKMQIYQEALRLKSWYGF